MDAYSVSRENYDKQRQDYLTHRYCGDETQSNGWQTTGDSTSLLGSRIDTDKKVKGA
jgi:hypothetical protein